MLRNIESRGGERVRSRQRRETARGSGNLVCHLRSPSVNAVASGGAGGYAPTGIGGIGWYRKRFRVPEPYKHRQVSIEFDGVYQNSEVRIDGQCSASGR
jgi:hypothetical protein